MFVPIALVVVGSGLVCVGVVALVCLVVAWFVFVRTVPRIAVAATPVFAELDEDAVLFGDNDTGKSHVSSYKVFDERMDLSQVVLTPGVRLRPRTIPRQTFEEVADPDTDGGAIEAGEDEDP